MKLELLFWELIWELIWELLWETVRLTARKCVNRFTAELLER